MKHPNPFEIQFWEEETVSSGLWSERTCKLKHKYQWVDKTDEGPVTVGTISCPEKAS